MAINVSVQYNGGLLRDMRPKITTVGEPVYIPSYPVIVSAFSPYNSRLCELRIDYLIEDG